MKKILLLTLYIFSYFLAKAQTLKNCDLKISQKVYTNGQEIPFGDTVIGWVNIKNLGPDNIDSNEYIAIGKSISPISNVHTSGLNVGDSVDIKLFSFVNNESIDTTFTFCVWRKEFGDTSLDVYDDNNALNDSSCVTIILKSNQVGIAKNELSKLIKVYPNPISINCKLNIDLTKFNKSIEVVYAQLFDYTGKEITNKLLNLVNNYSEMQLDINKGLYFLILKDENNLIIHTQKLIVE